MFWNTGLSATGANTVFGNYRTGVSEAGGGSAMGVHLRRRQLAPEPYSLGHLRVLFQRLIDAQEGRGEGETTVVETLRAISEVVVYGENQDAKIAAKAAKAEAVQQRRSEMAAKGSQEITAPGGHEGAEAAGQENEHEGVGQGRVVTDIRREDAFFELFCEKNMMSRFIELLRSPPSRYGSMSQNSGSSTPAWGTTGGLDAIVRALTWGGDVLRLGGQYGGSTQSAGDGDGAGNSSRDSWTQNPRALSSKGERSSAEVQVQVIQTTSILVMNVKSDTSLFYLLSNDHVNDMIMFDFRLEDEEVLSHFASFLKTLSLRLNPNTVQFFLRRPRRITQEQSAADGVPDGRGSGGVEGDDRGKRGAGEGGHDEDGEGSSFPLYTRALEYICHADFHVRIAALTVVLNIYNQRDPLVKAYLNGPAARSASLPDRLVGALRSQCLVLADRAMAAGVGSPSDTGNGNTGGQGGAFGVMAVRDPTICRDSIAGLQDQVFYLEDVFASGQSELNAQLCESLVSRLVRPMLLGDWLSGRQGAMFPQVALCALAQLFIVVTYPPLVRLLVMESLGSGGKSGESDDCPLLALLQGGREELCLGALVVLQALAQNRVVRSDLGLAQDSEGSEFLEGPGDYNSEGVLRGQVEADATAVDEQRNESPSSNGTCPSGDASLTPLSPEVLRSTVDALCSMLAPSTASSPESGQLIAGAEGTATSDDASTPRGTVSDGKSSLRTSPRARKPRRHHLVLRLCGKVLASLAPPSPADGSGAQTASVANGAGLGHAVSNGSSAAVTSPMEGGHGGVEASDAATLADHASEESAVRTMDMTSKGGVTGNHMRPPARGSGEGGSRVQRELRDTVLQRIGDAHSAAAEAVLRNVKAVDSAAIVALEEEIREWSKRTSLDGAITNLPKMSSLILRWSLDNNTSLPPEESHEPDDEIGLFGDDEAADAAASEEEEARKRQRELRTSVQAFLEIRQVWRLLAGKGDTDPAVLSIAGLGPEASREQPREGGSLDLAGRECLACSIASSVSPSEEGRPDKGPRKRRSSAGAALAAAAVRRMGRSELYLVLDTKAFLLATPDRRRLTNGEVKSAAPLLHLVAAPDPDDETRLQIMALSHRPVALMRPVTPPRPSTPVPAGRQSTGMGEEVVAGDAGIMCDLQAWACELCFDNGRSCRLALQHMEGRRSQLRVEKMQSITDMLEASMGGEDG